MALLPVSYGPGDIVFDLGSNGSYDYGIELLGVSHTMAALAYSHVG